MMLNDGQKWRNNGRSMKLNGWYWLLYNCQAWFIKGGHHQQYSIHLDTWMDMQARSYGCYLQHPTTQGLIRFCEYSICGQTHLSQCYHDDIMGGMNYFIIHDFCLQLRRACIFDRYDVLMFWLHSLRRKNTYMLKIMVTAKKIMMVISWD